MSTEINPAAPHHLPMFVTAPGQTDVLFNVMAVFIVVMILAVVVFYFRLHAIPEQLAHKGQRVQFEIVAVLGLISLFTHNHLFWIAGLLLAITPIPDFSTPLGRMADSLGTMAGGRRRSRDVDVASEPDPEAGTSPHEEAAGIHPAPEMAVSHGRPLVAGSDAAASLVSARDASQRAAS